MDQSTREIRHMNWMNIINQCKNRPVNRTAKQWLADNGISDKSYYYWLRKIRLVSSLYIAQIKQKYGIIERENYNMAKSEKAKQPQCPPDKEKLIEKALRHFKMIS